MHFSEDDLRAALKRKDPGPGFTQRVMARVGQQEKTARLSERRRSWFAWLRPLRLHPAMVSVAVLLVLAVVSWMSYERYREIQIAREQEAARKAIQALKITNAKLSHVFQRVRQSDTGDPKVRKEVL